MMSPTQVGLDGKPDTPIQIPNPAILAPTTEFNHTDSVEAWHNDSATTPLGPLIVPRQS
jgi:hypothetical protein